MDEWISFHNIYLIQIYNMINNSSPKYISFDDFCEIAYSHSTTSFKYYSIKYTQ